MVCSFSTVIDFESGYLTVVYWLPEIEGAFHDISRDLALITDAIDIQKANPSDNRPALYFLKTYIKFFNNVLRILDGRLFPYVRF